MKFRTSFLTNAALLVTFCVGMFPPSASAQRNKNQKNQNESQGAAQSGAQCSPGTESTGAASSSPPLPVEEIIARFAQHESDFKIARDNYTYTQEVLVEDLAPNHGEYQLTSDIVFTPAGRRYEQVTFAPQPSLVDFSLSPEDAKDLENIQPFVLTTEDLGKYEIQFAGREKLDELNSYKFCVGPKRIEKGQRYFQGTIWVDDHDLAIVKSFGKAVPDLNVGKDNENIFPRFTTYRENIEGPFWFPTYTRADDVLHFRNGDVRMRMTVRYKNYKRFGTTIKIGESKAANPQDVAPPNGQAPANQQGTINKK